MIGKIDADTFERIVSGRFGRRNPDVVVVPRNGVDAGVVKVGGGRVMVVAEDPIFPAPGLPLDTFGWFTVHIGASDVAVMGVKPEYMTYSLLLPPETGEEDLKAVVDSIHSAADELGISIVGGHTGYYPSVVTPVVGGVTVWGFTGEDEYVTPAGAEPGDDILLTKGPAIEAAALLAVLYEKQLVEEYGEALVEKAKKLCGKITVVEDALTAVEAGGVHAMHDATEGGVIGGLYEVADASGVGMEVDEREFIMPEEVKAVCDFLGIDSVQAIAEGSLLIACSPESTEEIIRALDANGVPVSRVGEVVDDTGTRTLRRLDGSVEELRVPGQDPFWPAFFKGLEQ